LFWFNQISEIDDRERRGWEKRKGYTFEVTGKNANKYHNSPLSVVSLPKMLLKILMENTRNK
jgi:hypothetical protein